MRRTDFCANRATATHQAADKEPAIHSLLVACRPQRLGGCDELGALHSTVAVCVELRERRTHFGIADPLGWVICCARANTNDCAVASIRLHQQNRLRLPSPQPHITHTTKGRPGCSGALRRHCAAPSRPRWPPAGRLRDAHTSGTGKVHAPHWCTSAGVPSKHVKRGSGEYAPFAHRYGYRLARPLRD